jgi:hypothetical protein
MKKESRRQERRKKKPGPLGKAMKWAGALAIVGLVVYAVSQSSGVAYTERDIAVVNFSELTPTEKRAALEEANSARCACGCGMTLAQCVSTDMTCPFREDNIQKIRGMVRAADKP